VSARLSNDEVVDRALEALRSSRVPSAEVFVRDALSGSVETKEGELEVVTARGERGLGVRVLDGQRIGFAHTSDLAPSGIEACVDQARRMATITEPDDDLRLANAPLEEIDLEIYQPGLEERPLADRGSRTSARRATATLR
jgi:PmbA protein